jgi:predicted O-methyltransferase YrrM
MRLSQGEHLFNFILERDLTNCLELGFYHGVSSAYIAGALHERGRGHLVTIDLEWARTLEPNIQATIGRLGLDDFVTYYYEPTSYHWRLMKLLRDSPETRFDLCYIDGGHTWSSTGFAFCLVSRLLRPGGWIIFDDLDWTHEDPAVRSTPRALAMPAEERTSAQVGLVYELLVMRDPEFTEFVIDGQWGFARKRCL